MTYFAVELSKSVPIYFLLLLSSHMILPCVRLRLTEFPPLWLATAYVISLHSVWNELPTTAAMIHDLCEMMIVM